MKALITGAAGFAAGYLARDLAHAGWLVSGMGPEVATLPSGSGGVKGGTTDGTPWTDLVEGDVTDPDSVRRCLDLVGPDAVFHLAGISSVGAAEGDPVEAYRINCAGLLVLLTEVVALRRRSGADPFCLVVGSGEQYGSHEASGMPLPESAELRPVSVYASSKCAQEVAALQLQRAHGLRLVCTRSFNHSGPGQRPDFVLPALVRRATELKLAGGGAMAVGNLSPVRDFLHVEDVARAYRLLVDRGTPGSVYNVSSGTGVSIEQMASAILARVGVDAKLEVRSDLVRRVDVPVLVGDHGKLTRDTGWTPLRSLNDIVEELVSAASQ